MNIGAPIKRITVIPTKHPIVAPEPVLPAPPQRESAPATPAEPAKVPEKV